MPSSVESAKKKSKSRNCSSIYPVKYHIGHIPIRSMNVVSIYIPEMNMVEVAKLSVSSGISVAKLLAISGQPCETCKDEFIIIDTLNGPVKIPRGLLRVNKQNSGESLNKKKERKSK